LFAIRTGVGERVKNIHHGEDTRREGDLLSFQPIRIA
jgi:hypothetical protein